MKFYNLQQVSDILLTPIPYLRKLIRKHKLKGKFIGRQYIVNDEELKRFINSLGAKNER